MRLFSLAVSLTLACSTGRSHWNGVADRLSARALSLRGPSSLVASKSSRVAYLVVSSERVPRELSIEVDKVRREHRGGTLTDVDAWAKKEIAKVLSTYFSRVEVVDALPGDTQPHVVVDLAVAKARFIAVRVLDHGFDSTTTGTAELSWSVGVRVSGAPTYLMQESVSSRGATGETAERVYSSMLEQTTADFDRLFAEKAFGQILATN